MKRKILPTITTITPSAWRSKIAEAKKLGLKEVAVFPTCLKLAERKELYKLLKESGIEKIPFVHLRSDMELWELDYLIQEWGTEVFNTHTQREFSIPADWQKHKGLIYIENTYEPFDEEEVKRFAGVCLDFSHLENARQFYPDVYRHNVEIIEKYPCGCNHVGPARNFPFLDKATLKPDYRHPHSSHLLKDVSELDYLKNYPKNYFSPFLAVEIENDLATQLKAGDYVTRMLK